MKKWLCIGAGFGAGAVLMAALLIGGFTWYSNRPKPERAWNTTTLKATYHLLSVDEGDRLAVHFSYVVENTTDFDYSLDPKDDISIMTVLPENKGLGGNEEVALASHTFIPAKQKVSITLDKFYDYNESYPKAEKENTEKLTAFMHRRLKELAGFVMFDKRNRYMVKFPSGWEDAGRDEKK